MTGQSSPFERSLILYLLRPIAMRVILIAILCFGLAVTAIGLWQRTGEIQRWSHEYAALEASGAKPLERKTFRELFPIEPATAGLLFGGPLTCLAAVVGLLVQRSRKSPPLSDLTNR